MAYCCSEACQDMITPMPIQNGSACCLQVLGAGTGVKRSPLFFLQRHARGLTSASKVSAAPHLLELQQASAHQHPALDGSSGAGTSGSCRAEPVVRTPASHGNDNVPGGQAVQDKTTSPASASVCIEVPNTLQAHGDSERGATACMVQAGAAQDESSSPAPTSPVRGVAKRRRGWSPGGLGSPALQGLMQV